MPADVAMFKAEASKQYGKNAVSTLNGIVDDWPEGTYIPTSSVSINESIGIGGIPKGRIIEILGPEASGKSTLALDIIANLQKREPDTAVFYQDNENVFNPTYARAIGVDLAEDRFVISQTVEAEEGLDLTYKAISRGFPIAIVDSVAGLALKSDLESESTTDSRVGGTAKALHAHLKKMNSIVNSSGATVIYINHIHYKPGIAYGNPETSPGGKGLPFYASLRIDVRQKEKLVDKTTGEVYGIKCQAKMIKNKMAPPFRIGEYSLIFGQGIDGAGSIVDQAFKKGLLIQSGPWIYLDKGSSKEQKFKGRAKLEAALDSLPSLEAYLKTSLGDK